MEWTVPMALVFFSCAILSLGQPSPVKEFQIIPKEDDVSFSFSPCLSACFDKNVTGFSSPKTWLKSGLGSQGIWMTDPATGCGAEIYLAPGYRTQYLDVYLSMADISKKTKKRRVEVPGKIAGTGAVVWNNSLYYSRHANRSIARLDLTSGQLLSSRALPASASHKNGGGHYQWGGASDVDFAVSETGIFVLYASKTDSLRLVVAKMDPISLEFEFAYVTTKPKKQFGNCFVVCATLYCTGSYNAQQTTTSLVYEIVTRQEISRPLPFANAKGGSNYNSYISYNPADKKLYSWDQGRLLTYDVMFS